MSRLFLIFEIRYLPFVMSIVMSAAFAVALVVHPNFIWLWIGFGIAAFFLSVGLHDIWQKPSAVLRNYPIAAHLRFILESIRPEIRQYFFEDEKNALPFSRDKRAIVYQRAKMALDADRAFQEETRNAARALVAAVRLMRRGRLPKPDSGLANPRPK